MPAWHPADNLLPIAWLFPILGTKKPLAEIRYLPVRIGNETVWRFRAVDITAEPRELIGAGYFDTLRDAAMACHHRAVHLSVPAVKSYTPKGAWGEQIDR